MNDGEASPPAADQPPASGPPATEQAGPEQAGSEQPGSEQPGPEQPGPEQSGPEQPAPEQATAPQQGGTATRELPPEPPPYRIPAQRQPEPGFSPSPYPVYNPYQQPVLRPVPQWAPQRSPAVDSRVVWIGPDGVLHQVPTYPQLPPPPPRRRRWPIWVAVGVVGALLLCAAPLAFLVSRMPLLPTERAEAANPTAGPPPSPGPNSPARVRSVWVADQIRSNLDKQSVAVLAGDQKAYLATASPKASKLVATLKRRFGSLRALKVAEYTQSIASLPYERGTSSGAVWSVKVEVRYCFVVKGCDTDAITVETTWAETADGLRMASLDASVVADNGPRPWEVSTLRAAVGRRAVVATTERYASRLPALLKEAEKAAAIADRFVLGGKRPDRYRIFVAGRSEWKKWYGSTLPDWSVGYATSISRDRMEVVLNFEEIQRDYMDEVMRHEFGHVATLSSDGAASGDHFWLIEGIAEYIQESGRPVGRYDGRFAVQRYLNSGKWNGRVDVAEPTASTADWQVAAKYGIGYYAMRRIAERFGRAKMIEFFSRVVLRGTDTLDRAARSLFGVSWANVNADCARYIRRVT